MRETQTNSLRVINSGDYPEMIRIELVDPLSNLTRNVSPLHADLSVEHRFDEMILVKKTEIMRNFNKAGLDYLISVHYHALDMHFRNGTDSMKAASYLFPEQTFEFEFLTYPEGVPKDYLETVTQRLQNSFDKVDLEKAKLSERISLRAVFDQHCIRVRAKGVDIISLLGHADNLQKAFTPA